MIVLSKGMSAQSLRELHERISQVPPESLLHHFHETLPALHQRLGHPHVVSDRAPTGPQAEKTSP